MSHNRNHDKQSSEIAARHDKVKEENRKIREQKEKDRIAKYETPNRLKKDSHTLQMELHKLLSSRTVTHDHNTKQKFKVLKEMCLELGIWEGFVTKYKMQSGDYSRYV